MNPPATHASFRAGKAKIHHVADGGRMREQWGFGWGVKTWTCSKCGHQWAEARIIRFSETELAARFDLRGDIEPGAHRLEEVTEGKNTFTRLVPL